jgi:hypothetical protein
MFEKTTTVVAIILVVVSLAVIVGTYLYINRAPDKIESDMAFITFTENNRKTISTYVLQEYAKESGL